MEDTIWLKLTPRIQPHLDVGLNELKDLVNIFFSWQDLSVWSDDVYLANRMAYRLYYLQLKYK